MLDSARLQRALTVAEAETCAAIRSYGEDLVVGGDHQGLVAGTPVHAGFRHFFQELRLEQAENRPFRYVQDHDRFIIFIIIMSDGLLLLFLLLLARDRGRLFRFEQVKVFKKGEKN